MDELNTNPVNAFQPNSEPVPMPAAPVGPVPKPRKSPLGIIMTIVSILLLAGAGGLAYIWQQDVSRLSSENTTLKSQLQQATATKGDDDLIKVAAENYCEAQVGIDIDAREFTLSKAGQAQKDILYSTDKQFAYVNVICDSTATDEATSGIAYYLKKVNSNWVVVDQSQQEPTAAVKALYSLPDLFE